jgi:hypothetical protein
LARAENLRQDLVWVSQTFSIFAHCSSLRENKSAAIG